MNSLRLLCSCVVALAVAGCAGARVGNTLPLSPPAVREARPALARFETEHRWGRPNDNRWEPVNAADSDSQWVYQMTTNQRPDYLLVRASSDGGRTWSPARHLCARGVKVPFQYDPQIVVASGGTVDVVCLDGFKPGVVFAQSHDRGQTWSKAVRLDGSLRYSDKPTLLVSASGRDVYVGFNAGYALYVASSHDYGATWRAPVKATGSHFWYYANGGTVAPDGTIWFAVDGETGRNETGLGHVELVTSADRGASWRELRFTSAHEGAPCRLKNCYPDFFTAQEAVAVDRARHFVFVFAKNDFRQGPNVLYASLSHDGLHWTAPAAINSAGNSTSPAISAGPKPGDFRLVWQDNRNGSISWNTWYARSTDGGETWSAPIRLSDRGSGAPYKHGDGYDFPFGDYLGLSVDSNGINHVIWGEGSAVYYPGGTWWTRGV